MAVLFFLLFGTESGAFVWPDGVGDQVIGINRWVGFWLILVAQAAADI